MLGIISTGSIIFVALVVHTPETAQYPAIAAVQVGMGAIMLLICCFCAFTVVGVFRMKRWGRVCIVIIGGILALFWAPVAILFVVFAFSSLIPIPNTSSVSPEAMRYVFLGLGGFSLLIALIGVWWLVYFNLRRIRALFATNGGPAQPELLSYTSLPQTQLPQGPATSQSSTIEILLTCLAVLYLVGAACGIVMALIQFPLFFLGFIFHGVSASIVALAFTIFNLGVGIGILRRTKAAWVAALAFQIVGLVSSVLMFVPRERTLMADYQLEIVQRMFSWSAIPVPTPNPYTQEPIYIFSAILSLVVVSAVIWLLLRARPLFEPKKLT